MILLKKRLPAIPRQEVDVGDGKDLRFHVAGVRRVPVCVSSLESAGNRGPGVAPRRRGTPIPVQPPRIPTPYPKASAERIPRVSSLPEQPLSQEPTPEPAPEPPPVAPIPTHRPKPAPRSRVPKPSPPTPLPEPAQAPTPPQPLARTSEPCSSQKKTRKPLLEDVDFWINPRLLAHVDREAVTASGSPELPSSCRRRPPSATPTPPADSHSQSNISTLANNAASNSLASAEATIASLAGLASRQRRPTVRPVDSAYLDKPRRTPSSMDVGLLALSPNLMASLNKSPYSYTLDGVPGSPAQLSAAAAFFARAAQKFQLPSSPHRRKGTNGVSSSAGGSAAPTASSAAAAAAAAAASCAEDEAVGTSGFSAVLRHSPPPPPPVLLRRLGTRDVTGVGKVKVLLRVVDSPPSSDSQEAAAAETDAPSSTPLSIASYLTIDSRRKQVTLCDPEVSTSMPEDRRVGVAAPKMFAFDAIFSPDDSQSEVCSVALTDLLHAVLNGNDGVLFCFGHSRSGQAETMLGSTSPPSAAGVIVCAISWLFRAIAEMRAKGGKRFSVRVSAVEARNGRTKLTDLLAEYANDSEQSPGVYLRDDPLLDTQLQNHCELRVPTAEKAAFYLDCALLARGQPADDAQDDSHLFFTLHVYQYSVAGKGGVAGGRSRLHLIDLGGGGGPGPERPRNPGGLPLSALGHVLLAIFNGQKHIPHREHKVTQLLKECLSPITCHAALVVHVSPATQNYAETLATVQLASRVHRMRRRRLKFPGQNCATSTNNDEGRLQSMSGSSDLEPSSSEQSADTVIYVGPADETATDGEHPPVYLPSLADGDQRGAMGRALRGSSAEHRPGANKPLSKDTKVKVKSTAQQSSPKGSPSRTPSKTTSNTTQPGTGSEERWIDGPRVSKSKVVEARSLIHGKRETWVDGPLHATFLGNGPASGTYGFMDSHKKSMIRKWVENQSAQMKETSGDTFPADSSDDDHLQAPVENVPVNRRCNGRSSRSHRQDGDSRNRWHSPAAQDLAKTTLDVRIEGTQPAPNPVNPTSVAVTPLTPNTPGGYSGEDPEVGSLSGSSILTEPDDGDYNEMDDILAVTNVGDDCEIIEVIEPTEPVPMQDSCLQVTEEDIALSLGILENPLPEVDQRCITGSCRLGFPIGGPHDHPLRVLSQENLTVVSTFADSCSLSSDPDLPPSTLAALGRGPLVGPGAPGRPRFAHTASFHAVAPRSPTRPCSLSNTCRRGSTGNSSGSGQLALLHDLYRTKMAAAAGSRRTNSDASARTLSLSDVLSGVGTTDVTSENGGLMSCAGPGCGGNVPDPNQSVYSEPAYAPKTLCDACQRTFTWRNSEGPFSTTSLRRDRKRDHEDLRDRYCDRERLGTQRYYALSSLRHPDGASNPDLKEETLRDRDSRQPGSGCGDCDPKSLVMPPCAADVTSPNDSEEEQLPAIPPPLQLPLPLPLQLPPAVTATGTSSPSPRLQQRLLSLSDQSGSPRSGTPVSGDGLTADGVSGGPGSGGSGPGSATGSGTSAAPGSSSGYESFGSAPASCSGGESALEHGTIFSRDEMARLERRWNRTANSNNTPASNASVAPCGTVVTSSAKSRLLPPPARWTYEPSPTAGCLPDTWAWCWCAPWAGEKCNNSANAPVAASTKAIQGAPRPRTPPSQQNTR